MKFITAVINLMILTLEWSPVVNANIKVGWSSEEWEK
jgi:hypothetical protein